MDTMHSEIRAMHSTLQALLRQNSTPTVQPTIPTPAMHAFTTPESDISHGNISESTHVRQAENTHMAMTRENSLEPEASDPDDEPRHMCVLSLAYVSAL